MIPFYVIIYGILLSFSRYYGICSATNIPLFGLLKDPSAYSGDMYVSETVMAKTTYLYDILRWFGPMAGSEYFVFILYTIVGVAHVYLFYKIAEYLYPQLKEYQFGLMAVLFFLYDHQIFSGAYHQIIAVNSFRQTIVNMPIIAASIYLFLKNKPVQAIFVTCIFAIPMHFRSAWVYVIVYFTFMLMHYKEFTWKQFLSSIVFMFTGLGILLWFKSRMHIAHVTHDQSLELLNIIIKRYAEEGSPFLNSKLDFLRLALFIIPGIYCIRFINDQKIREKLYLFFTILFVFFFLGGIYFEYLYPIFPSMEIYSLGFPQLVTYPILFSFVLIGGALVTFLKSKDKLIRILAVIGIFSLAYLPNFKLKSIPVYLACIVVASILIRLNKKISTRMKLNSLTTVFFISCMLFMGFKCADRVRQAAKAQSNVFPLHVFGFDIDEYNTQMWVNENTSKNSVILPLRYGGNGLGFDDFFRKYSLRPLFSGDVANVMYDYNLVQEHFKRQVLVDSLMKNISDEERASTIVRKSEWEIDYIVLPKPHRITYDEVYENSNFTIFKITERAHDRRN